MFWTRRRKLLPVTLPERSWSRFVGDTYAGLRRRIAWVVCKVFGHSFVELGPRRICAICYKREMVCDGQWVPGECCQLLIGSWSDPLGRFGPGSVTRCDCPGKRFCFWSQEQREKLAKTRLCSKLRQKNWTAYLKYKFGSVTGGIDAE